MSELNIYQRINKVMSECDYLQKTGSAAGKGIKYDEVMAMIRQLLISNGIVMVVRQIDMEYVGSLKDKQGKEGNQKIYQGRYEMDLINMDNPSEIVTHSAYAHGMEGGDKGPGKADTYAVKLMLVMGFGIETGDDEESRSEKLDKLNTISETEQNDIAGMINGDNNLWATLCSAYKICSLSEIPSSKLREFKELIIKNKQANNANI